MRGNQRWKEGRGGRWPQEPVAGQSGHARSLQRELRMPEVALWTAAALCRLRSGGFRPRAWAHFLGAAIERWRQDGRKLPRLRRSLRRWVATSACLSLLLRGLVGRQPPALSSGPWLLGAALMADWHLGMIPSRCRPAPAALGLPNRLTLLRATLPAALFGLQPGRRSRRLRLVAGGLALTSDFLDGWIAKRRADRTHFGAVADPLVDSAMWISFAWSGSRARGSLLTWLVIARYVPPALLAIAWTFLQGQTFDWAPSRVGRWSSALLASILLSREARRDDLVS